MSGDWFQIPPQALVHLIPRCNCQCHYHVRETGIEGHSSWVFCDGQKIAPLICPKLFVLSPKSSASFIQFFQKWRADKLHLPHNQFWNRFYLQLSIHNPLFQAKSYRFINPWSQMMHSTTVLLIFLLPYPILFITNLIEPNTLHFIQNTNNSFHL